MIPMMDRKTSTALISTLAYKECGIDTFTNLMNMRHHEVDAIQKWFEKLLKEQEKQMKKSKSEMDAKARRSKAKK